MTDQQTRKLRGTFRADVGVCLSSLKKIKQGTLPAESRSFYIENLSKSLRVLARIRKAHPQVHNPRTKQLRLPI